jgi:signal peptidase II
VSSARTTSRRPVLIGILFAIAVVVIVVDQATKQIAIAVLEDRPSIPVLGELAGFTFYRNPGAAFGMGENTTWLFAVIAVVVLAGILIATRRLGSRIWAWGLGLLLGGLTGNLIDRLFRPPGFMHGAVVDFIDLSFFICNVADIAISAAAVLIVLATLRGIGLDGSRDGEHSESRDLDAKEQV